MKVATTPRQDQNDHDAGRAAASFAEYAFSVLASEPRVTCVEAISGYGDYNDEYYSNPTYTMVFSGSHTDEDLDSIPAVRRLERLCEELLGSVPFSTESYSSNVQEQARILVNSERVRIVVAPYEDQYDFSDRVLEMRLIDGQLGPLRKFIRMKANSNMTAHMRLAARGDMEVLRKAVGSDYWFEGRGLVPTGMEIDTAFQTGPAGHGRGEYWLIEIDPSIDLLGLDPAEG